MTAQCGLCCYCESPMWETDPLGFASAHGIPADSLWCYQCTTEHLLPRALGGSNRQDNIAAACRLCNQYRHEMLSPLAADEFREFVRSEVRAGRWAPRPASPGNNLILVRGRRRLSRLIDQDG